MKQTFLDELSPLDAFLDIALIFQTRLTCKSLVQSRLKVVISKRVFPTKK